MKFPKNERETILLYKLLQKQLGWKITYLQESFPDAIISKDGRNLKAEFEYRAQTFRHQAHPPERCDLLICWHNDWPDAPLPVWALDETAQEEAEAVETILQECLEPIANWIDFQNAQTERTEHLATCPQVAELFGLNRVTVWLRAKKHNIGRMIGGNFLFTKDEVEALCNVPDGRARKRFKGKE